MSVERASQFVWIVDQEGMQVSGILGRLGRLGAAIHGRLLLVVSVTTLIAAVALPQAAAAEATLGPEPVPGPTGLPDGRVYEQVSPANKHGNEALNYERPAYVAPDGDSVLYGASGALGGESSNSVVTPTAVSERTSHGWAVRSALPLPAEGQNGPEENVTVNTIMTLTVPSIDLTHVLFGTWGLQPYVGPPDETGLDVNVYITGSDPFAEPEWLGRALTEDKVEGFLAPAGASSDLGTVYLSLVGGISLPAGASHLYEYTDGALREVGALPNGESSPGPAAPAAQPGLLTGGRYLTSAAGYDNQVSSDGSHFFFVREDEAGTVELYAWMAATNGAKHAVLVSQSQLPGHAGEPAPHGPIAVASTEREADTYYAEDGGATSQPSYVFATPDGSYAFFQSVDRLTEAAPENGSAKTYVYDLETGTLEYLPGLTGSIVSVTNDGAAAVFVNTAAAPYELERWTAGPAGGTVTPIVSLPPVSRNVCEPVACVGPAYTSTDGEVVVFATDSPIAGFNDGGSHYELLLEELNEEPGGEPWPNYEVFRYDAKGNELSCLSCPPKGETPSSNAVLSKDDFLFNSYTVSGGAEILSPGNAVSADGATAFFETRDALVPQDTNGTVDVYEWENGEVRLISSGHSAEPSYLTGVSESGGDAFFMTAEGIAPGDDDAGYDVYDARIPRPGDRLPPEAVPCEGAVCQGPPSVPNLLGIPASEAFSGPGDLAPQEPLTQTKKSKRNAGTKGGSAARGKRLHKALRSCRRTFRHSRRKQRQCTRRARRRYGAHASSAPRLSSKRHHNGRGK